MPWLAFLRAGGHIQRQRIDSMEKQLLGLGHGATARDTDAPDRMTARIRALKDSRLGKTAYILGNATSLLSLDVDKLMELDSFWFNKAFALQDKGINFHPKHYFLFDPIAMQSWGEKVMNMPAGIKFIGREAYDLAQRTWPELVATQDVIRLDVQQAPGNYMDEDENNFSHDPSKFIYSGYTSALIAIQMAFYMGYSRVLVGGVELDYSQPYFYDEHAMRDTRAQDWLAERMRAAFIVARGHFERQGRVLVKITPSPHLPLDYLDMPELRRI